MEKAMLISKKRICIVAIIFCLAGLYGVKLYAVNTDVRLPERQIFEKGEVVSYDKDFNISADNTSEGYTIQVVDSKIMEAGDFCRTYDVKDMGIVDYYYMVKVSVKNVDNDHVGEQGIPLGMSMLIGTNYSMIPSPEMFYAANPGMPGMSFSLQLDTEKEIWLVFQMIPGSTPDCQHLEKEPPMLQITQYPHQKLIRLL